VDDVTVRADEFDAVIFDLDGVITKTAAVHEVAWAEMFDGFLRAGAEESGTSFEPFTSADYGEYVDGKPRYDGVASFLESRGIELAWGDPTDPPDAETVCGLGNRKNAEFTRIVTERGVEPYESSVRFINELHERGFRTALFSSSRNADAVLAAAGLGDLFAVRVEGRLTAELGLPGKPDPAVLLEAMHRIGATPDRTAVVEDAISGVEAGRRGEFALVIGLDRLDQADALAASGADVVVPDLADVTIAGSHLQEAATLPSARSGDLWSALGELQPAVFLDYDGVLTPIVEHPDLAVLSDEGRAALEALAVTTTVAIVSGRDADDVIGKVGLPGLYYAGSHGFDIRSPSGDGAAGDLDRFDAFLPDLAAAEGELRAALADVPGSNIERKRFAIAVHYRQVPNEHHATVAEAVDRIAPGYASLRVAGGKMIYELRPDIHWDKGTALRWLLTEMGLDVPEVLPVYIGDDVTDEDAFRELEHRGIGIVVGREERPTRAHYALDDTDEVRLFLDELRARVAGRTA